MNAIVLSGEHGHAVVPLSGLEMTALNAVEILKSRIEAAHRVLIDNGESKISVSVRSV